MHGINTIAALNAAAAEAQEIMRKHGFDVKVIGAEPLEPARVDTPEPPAQPAPVQPPPAAKIDARWVFHGNALWVLPVSPRGLEAVDTMAGDYNCYGLWRIYREEDANVVFAALLSFGLNLAH